MTSKQIQQIFQYIQANGNYLGSEKVLRQVQKNQDMIWQILVRLSSKIMDRNIENAFGQMSFFLQSQKHERSIKWLKDYMMIQDLAGKTQSNYTIIDYIRPQKDKILSIISKIIQILKGTNKLRQQFDYQIVTNDLLAKDFIKYRSLQQSTTKQLKQLRQRKLSQLPYYQQKLKQKNQIIKKINQKKKQKLQKLQKQRHIQQQYNKKLKESQQLDFETADQKFIIVKLKRQITINAPQVKKQRRALQQQHHQIQESNSLQSQIMTHNKKIIQKECQHLQNITDGILDQANKIISIFHSLQDNKDKLTKNIKQHEKHIHKRTQLITRQQQLQIKLDEERLKKTQFVHIIKNVQDNYNRDQKQLQQKKNSHMKLINNIGDLKQKHDQYMSFLNKTQQSIKSHEEKFQIYKKQIQSTYQQWLIQTTNHLQKLRLKNQKHKQKLYKFNNPQLLNDLYQIGKQELMKKMDIIQQLQSSNNNNNTQEQANYVQSDRQLIQEKNHSINQNNNFIYQNNRSINQNNHQI